MQLSFRLLFLLLILFCNNLLAQVCTGSLGDPVFKFDFGSGDTPKFPVTGYTYKAGSCPEDGQYSISKTETGCHDATWHRVLSDHTGNDGYMMVVNADEVANKVFFTKNTNIDGTDVGALCEKTGYEFSAYILNLMKPNQPGIISPRVTFIITDLDGKIITQSSPITIPETSDDNGWEKYGVFFETPAHTTSVIVKMVNNAPGGNGNDLLLDDISFRPCISNTIQAGFLNQPTGTIKNQCVGDKGDYAITATPPAGYDMVWQENKNEAGWIDLDAEKSTLLLRSFPPGYPIGTYRYRLGIAHEGNLASLNCRIYSNPVSIVINDYPHPLDILPKKVCEGERLILSATGGANYKWTGLNLPAAGVIANPLVVDNVILSNAGEYHVEVISETGCSTPKSVQVTVIPRPVISSIAADALICEGGASSLKATTSGANTYSWYPADGMSDAASSHPAASPTKTTTYKLTAFNADGCSVTDSITIVVNKPPVVSAGNAKAIFEGQSTTLNGSVTGDFTGFSWSPTTAMSNPNTLTPIVNPTDDIIYTLTVTSPICEPVIKPVFVRVYKKIIIPNSFSPNNDGVNDLWNIEALFTYAQSTTAVYNRNGQQVFFSRGYTTPWNGKLNGDNLPSGTYYYVINLNNGTKPLSGWVLIIR
ncbi:gliding motility-associated C-terminal domain-containing protein [Mucilaginibacter achroorhodeus]|uniref:Gliding motility-associated C-terminal domain-containing protein n=1 Tax=Mucilaginibacter achroorhodeus TaxID=2599294 RepID=A0A563UAF9_9SPHI|nr:gliding motility-associated C-terminal domain-containing protein [Mucilaginibacter achroorhodeus]